MRRRAAAAATRGAHETESPGLSGALSLALAREVLARAVFL